MMTSSGFGVTPARLSSVVCLHWQLQHCLMDGTHPLPRTPRTSLPSRSINGSWGTCFFNLDCDSILGPGFMDNLKTLLPTVPPHGCIHAVGRGPGTTGKVGLWAKTFVKIGGYDEDMYPMGYQDVDIIGRCRWLSNSKTCYMKVADENIF